MTDMIFVSNLIQGRNDRPVTVKKCHKHIPSSGKVFHLATSMQDGLAQAEKSA